MIRMVPLPRLLVILCLGMTLPVDADPLRIVIDMRIVIDVEVIKPMPSAAADSPAEIDGQTDAPERSELPAGELEDMRVAVKACWNLGSLPSEAMRVTVVVGLSLSQNGTPDTGSIRMISAHGGDDAAAKRIYDTARRAIIRCGKNGFPLPPEKYETWKELELVFDPNGMRLR